MTVQTIRNKVNALCDSKGIKSEKVRQDIVAYLVLFGLEYGADPLNTLALLEDDTNLTPIEVIASNFRKPLKELISDKLNADPIFPHLFERIIYMVDRSIGVGEVALPFILANYSFSYTGGDGRHTYGGAEIKKDNSSLKCIESNKTNKGLVDILNKKYFSGTAPGMLNKKKFQAHVDSVTDPSVYAEYFTELYPGVDTTQLAQDVAECYSDMLAVNNVFGRYALKRYQAIDGWFNLFYIIPETMEVVNISDPSDIDELGLVFHPKFKRGGCTQALADGYVDVKF